MIQSCRVLTRNLFRKLNNLYYKPHSMSVCMFVHFHPGHIHIEKFPSLNASSPLECLLKPEGRAWAASGGPCSPFGFEEAFKGGRGIQGGKRHSRGEFFHFFFNFSKFESFIFSYSSLGHGESKCTLGFKISP